MKKIFFLFLCLFLAQWLFAQGSFTCYVKDADTKEALPAVTATVKGTRNGARADSLGKIVFTQVSGTILQLEFSFVGYQTRAYTFRIPQTDSVIVYLEKQAHAEEEIIINASRTNSRIEDLPTKVEVLGSEEVDEEAGTIPGNIASLLGDVAGIQNQRTSATTGGIDLRVQGLPGKYTQILRDGLPLFGGYSGGFSVLQIPPLDLKQVELIKGASSTLYGGGAIAGMINLVSKTPKLNQPQHSLLVNYSSLRELNINTFHSRRNQSTGYTLFMGTTQQKAVDVNKDGYSDVPNVQAVFIHPTFFFYPTKKNIFTIEYDGTYEDRKGGDVQVLEKGATANHAFIIQNKSYRHAIAGTWEQKINTKDRINAKALINFYDRSIRTNVFGMRANQHSFFTELSYLKNTQQHTLVTGINVSGENFTKRLPDSSGIANYKNIVAGIFMQDDWKITPQVTAQVGVRLDNNNAYVPVILPRLSILYKINTAFTSRLGGGMGYKAPSVFNNDVDERALRNHPLSSDIRLEKSLGMNWDINFKKRFANWQLTLNQMFYITEIKHPVIEDINGGLNYQYVNASQPFNTKGFETYMALMHSGTEIYLGYTYTIARQLFNPSQIQVPLSARSKFAAVISNEFSSRLRACIEASYTGKQYLDDGSKTPGYFISAGMIRYDIHQLSLVFNCENIFDYRQSRKENIVYGSPLNPSFKQIWAPVDGRVMNVSARFNF